ncbi:MAG: hypothetical protein RR404_01040 [Bacilli bacterium]
MNQLEFLLNILLPICSIIIPVFATIYTVNKRIKAQTRENHQPHLILDKIRTIENINKYKYYLTLFGKNFQDVNKNFVIEDIIKNEKENTLNIEIILKNIGYGVATNIKFYDLLDSNQIYGSQKSSQNENQQLFTTFDIAANEEKKVSVQIIGEVLSEDNIIREDHNRILCVYKDLNNNVDSFIITINVKTQQHYDYFAYQPSSISYRKWIKENKKQYKKILDKYNDM